MTFVKAGMRRINLSLVAYVEEPTQKDGPVLVFFVAPSSASDRLVAIEVGANEANDLLRTVKDVNLGRPVAS